MYNKIDEGKEILRKLGMPEAQQGLICAYTILTLAGLKPNSSWHDATNEWIRIHDILAFAKDEYGKVYAENTRETIRKNCMHQLRDAAIVEDNGMSTNSPNYRYRLTEEALKVIKLFKKKAFSSELRMFHSKHEKLIEKYSSKKKMEMMAVCVNSQELLFSTGKHNELQKSIIEDFVPRFAPGAQCLYIGDTAKKDLFKDADKLAELGFEITLHDKMPDVVLYMDDKQWLFFVEAVTSVGPMSPKRVQEIQHMTKCVSAGKIFVTAFPGFAKYKEFSSELAWETEVWLAELPDHMIHLNGDKFLGPR